MKKTILVTGGSGVIGLSILRHFYKKGFNVVAAGLSKKNHILKIKKEFKSSRSLILNTIYLNYGMLLYHVRYA